MIIDGLIIVEGISDVAFLSSFVKAEFMTTGGYTIPKKEIEFAKRVGESKKVIVLTDSDEAGITIRNRINELIPNTYNVLLDINKCNKNGKHGVAESTKEEVIKCLSEYELKTDIEYGKISANDLYKLGIIGPGSKEKREIVTTSLRLGICDGKKLVRRINFLNIKLDEIIEVLESGN